MSTVQLVGMLTKNSVASRSGIGVTSVLAVLAITVGSLVAFLLGGGTWMFYQRMLHPTPTIQAHLDDFYLDLSATWFYLALLACALLVPIITSLASQAAVLGASGREQRLSALRLLGLSGRQITAMTVTESGAQALVGIVLGGVVSLPALTAFTAISFQGQAIRATELVLPWWGYLGIALAIFLLVLVSSAWSMQRVRVTPLAVSRQEIPPAAKRWCLIVFIIGFVLVVVMLWVMTGDYERMLILGLGSSVIIVAALLNVVMPFILRLVTHVAAGLPGTANFVAAQRVLANPKQAWRRTSGLAFLGLMAGVLTSSPSWSQGADSDVIGTVFTQDIVTGIRLVLIFGFLLIAVSLLLTQANSVYETADLTRSLQHIGVPRAFHSTVAALEVLAPAILGSLLGYVVGVLLGSIVVIDGLVGDLGPRLAASFLVLVAGWVLLALSLLAVEPIRNQVLRRVGRAQD